MTIEQGGTGQITQQAAINALSGTVTSGQYLRGNGTNVIMSAIQAGDVPTLNQNTTGSAATLTTGRTIGMTGDVTWTSASFNGSQNVTGTATLANSGVSAGTYTKVTVDAKGRVTSGTTLSASDVPTLNQNTTGTAASAATWTTARTFTIGSTGRSVDGSAAVSWSLSDIGAAATNQTFFIGTTQVAINRASGALSLNGVNIDGSAGSATNATNATNATQLSTGRTIGMTGDVTWTSASFNGSSNVTGTATLANTSTARTNIGLGTANSPTFTGLTLTGTPVGLTVNGRTDSAGFLSTTRTFNFDANSSIFKQPTGNQIVMASAGINIATLERDAGNNNLLRLSNDTANPHGIVNYVVGGGFVDAPAVGVGQGGINFWVIKFAGNKEIYTSLTANVGKVGGGTFFSTSDSRLKTNIRDYTVGLDTIMQIEPKRFDLLDRDRKARFGVDRVQLKDHVGLIAQEVLETDLSDMVWENVDGYYNIENTNLTFALVNAVKTLKTQNDQLQDRLDQVELRLQQLEDHANPPPT